MNPLEWLAGMLVEHADRWCAAHEDEIETRCTVYRIARSLGASRLVAVKLAIETRTR